MIRPLLSVSLLALALGLAAPAQLPKHDSGTLVIAQHGTRLGQEHFQLRNRGAGGRLQVQLQYRVGGGRIKQRAELQWFAGGRLRAYAWRQGADRITVRFASKRLRARYQPAHGQAQTFLFQLPPTTAILDANVYSLWEPLADRYNWSKGGTQTFSVFVPHTGDPGQVRLTEIPVGGHGPGHQQGEEQLRAETSQATVYLLLQRGRLLRLTMPAAGLIVTRQ